MSCPALLIEGTDRLLVSGSDLLIVYETVNAWGESWGDSWGDSWTEDVCVEVAAETPATGGGKSKYRKSARSKYPRRVMVDGVLHWVRNANEERQLLQALADRAETAAKLAVALDDKPLAKRINKRTATIAKRMEAVDDRESDWLRQLIEEDDEILMMM